MAHDNMKKWLSVLDDVTVSKTDKRMLTEDTTDVVKDMHSKVLARPEASATADTIIAKVAGGMRGINKQEIQSKFDAFSKDNGFANFADELKSAKGAHDEEMRVAESLVDEEDMEEGNEFSGALAAAKAKGKKSFEVDGKTYPVKEGLVDEEDMEEGNEFSGALAAAKAKGEKSFEVDGKTYPVKEDEEVCPVCEAMPCECDGSKEEMISEEWSVIYDSAYAKNVPARVRLKSGMDESAVREWFNKAFQPLNIHEVFKPTKTSKNMEEEQLDEILAPLAAGAARVGSTLAQGAKAVGGAVVQGAKALAGQAAGAMGQQQDPKAPKGLNIVLDKTGRVVQGPGKGQKFQGVSVVPESVDRSKRGDTKSVNVKDLLDDIHMRLDGNYDLKNQQQAIHAVAKLNSMPYETLLTHWFEDSDGLNKEEAAAAEVGEMPPAGEIPATEPAPEALPGEELVAPAQGQEEEPVMEAHAVTLHIEDDHEVKMAQSSLYQVAKDAAALHVLLDGVDNLEGWVQSKITLAADYIARVRDYMEYETVRNSEMPNEEHHTYEDEIFEDRVVKKKKK